MSKLKCGLTQETLKKNLHYDAKSGIFTRLNNKVKRAGIAKKHYLLIWVEGEIYYAHRLAWLYMTGEWPKMYVDHIDGNRANNKWKNLREATNTENSRNCGVSKNNKLGIKGISKNRNGYAVRINLGTFKTKEEAVKVYNKFAIKYFGKFARLSVCK